MIRSLQDILVITDMDNTLLTPEAGIPQVNQDTIRLFCMLGGRFTIATGRTAVSAGRHLTSLPLSAPAAISSKSWLLEVRSMILKSTAGSKSFCCRFLWQSRRRWT